MQPLLPEKDLPADQSAIDERRRMDAVLVYVSPNAFDGHGHLRVELQEVIQEVQETNRIHKRLIPIAPVLLYETPVPGALSNWKPVRLDRPEGLSQLISRLTEIAAKIGADLPKQLAVPSSLSRGDLPNRLVMKAPIHLECVLVPACVHWMGSQEGVGFDAERPCCTIPLSDYYVSRYPITVDQFSVFVRATGYRTTAEEGGHGRDWACHHTQWVDIPGATWHHPYGPDQPPSPGDHPATQVSWHDAMAFCNWLRKASVKQVTLPSEAEWDRAARGPKIRTYPWGNDNPDPSLCNYNKTIDGTTPVGQYSPRDDSYYGCGDMAGNVWEWTRSLYRPYPYQSNDGREDLSSLENRALRGGSYHGGADYIRASIRENDPPTRMLTAVGFRIVIIP